MAQKESKKPPKPARRTREVAPPKFTRRTEPTAMIRNAAPAAMIRNAAPAAIRNAAPESEETEAKLTTKVKERFQGMKMSHAIVGVGAYGASEFLGVMAVGTDTLGPFASAGLQIGAGMAVGAAGYAMESDHVMAAGTGMITNGAVNLGRAIAFWVLDDDDEQGADRAHSDPEKRASRRLAILDGNNAAP